MRWDEVQSDMRVDWCSAVGAAAVATARAAVGRTAVASGQRASLLDREGGQGIHAFARKEFYNREPLCARRALSSTPCDHQGSVKDKDAPDHGSTRGGGNGTQSQWIQAFSRKGFTPERSSTHVVLFRPPLVTSRVKGQWQGCPWLWFYQMWGEREEGDPSVHKEGILPPSAAARTSCAFAHLPMTSLVVRRTGAMPLPMDQPKVGGNRGQRCRFSTAAMLSHCNRT